MLAIPYLLLSFLGALVVIQRFFREFPALVRIVAAFALSIVVTGWVTLCAAWLIHSLGAGDATLYGSLVAMVVNAGIAAAGVPELWRASLRARPAELLGVAAALALSFWVMLQRLSGNPLKVSANTWGDTALHIGIARSFSQGDNFPPELPLFSGESIRYHFGLDFYAGVLERLGLPIEWAFNLPGALGFAAVMVLIYALAHRLWQSAPIGIVAATLFATNGSLAFLRYFEKYPSLIEALQSRNWWNDDKYAAIAPFQTGERISLFWTLNPYLTQTHLIISMVIVLFIGYAVLWHLRGPGGIAGDSPAVFVDEIRHQPLPRPRAIALGLISGASFWLNGILFVVSMVFLCVLFYVYRGYPRRMAMPMAVLAATSLAAFVVGAFLGSDEIRKTAMALLLGGLLLLGPVKRSLPFFAAAGVLALPQMIWLSGDPGGKSNLSFHDGYLVESFSFLNPQSYFDFASYWWLNLGFVGPLIILAAVLSRRADRKLLAAIMAIFVFGNLVVLGVDVGGHNHKVFNLWETLANLFAAYGFVWFARTLWKGFPAARRRLGLVAGRVVAVGVVPAVGLALVLSGLLDFMVLKNDPRFEVFGDAQPAISWIEHSTRRDAVFLTADGDVYTIPTLAGRKVYLGGFSIWASGMGYDEVSRQKKIASIYGAPDRATACDRLRGTGADYIQVGNSEMQRDRFAHTADLFPGEFVRAFTDGRFFSYYDVNASCGSSGGLAGRGS